MAHHMLGLGLLTHITGLILAMLPRLELLGALLYLIATALLTGGVAAHWKTPHKEPGFYIAALAAFLPLAGPAIAIKMVSPRLKNGDDRRPLLRLHPTAVLAWMLLLAVAITVTFVGKDRYFDAVRNTAAATPVQKETALQPQRSAEGH